MTLLFRSQRLVGMGLAVARSLVDGHGGTITATNHPVGGAVVTIGMPVEL